MGGNGGRKRTLLYDEIVVRYPTRGVSHAREQEPRDGVLRVRPR